MTRPSIPTATFQPPTKPLLSPQALLQHIHQISSILNFAPSRQKFNRNNLVHVLSPTRLLFSYMAHIIQWFITITSPGISGHSSDHNRLDPKLRLPHRPYHCLSKLSRSYSLKRWVSPTVNISFSQVNVLILIINVQL